MKTLRVGVKITEYEKERLIIVPEGIHLKEALDKEFIPYSLPCGGNGSCGRCRVTFMSGAPEASAEDKAHLSADEIRRGVRLLCRCVIDKDCHLVLDKRADDRGMKIEGAENSSIPECTEEALGKCFPDETDHIEDYTYGIAVDIGTTTIAAALIRVGSGEKESAYGNDTEKMTFDIIRTSGCANSQRKFGEDVISRISAAEDDEILARMGSLVVSDISKLIKELVESYEVPLSGKKMRTDIRDIVAVTITGNTTMLHLLMGRAVSSLGKYPYTPVALEMEKLEAAVLFGELSNAKLTILPGISAFVGADIVAGLLTIKMSDNGRFFFLDLGTNGEMAFYDGSKLKVASAAAGPVFEAGGISCGTASIPGAICHVEVDPKTRKASIETIRRKAPIGICGTGVMETVSELLKAGIMDETGLLTEEYFDEGYPLTEDGSIVLSQQDIRNVQLAKAAIFTGAKALLQDNVPDRVYVSGGFGSSIIPEKIVNLGMFPAAFDGKIETVGNSALKGAAMFVAAVLSGPEAEAEAVKKLNEIIAEAEVVELAALSSFDEDYIEAMNF